MNTMNHTVVLKSGTIGVVMADSIDYQDINDFIGEEVNIHFYDEIGSEKQETGILVEVV